MRRSIWQSHKLHRVLDVGLHACPASGGLKRTMLFDPLVSKQGLGLVRKSTCGGEVHAYRIVFQIN